MTVWFKKGFIFFLFGFVLLFSGCKNDPRNSNDTTPTDPTGWFASSTLSKGVFFATAADPSNPNIIYAGSSAIGVYRTDNGGATWTNANRGLPLQPTRSLFVDPKNTKGLFAGTAGGGVFFSIDSGATWQPINSGLSNLDVYAVAYNPHAAPTGLQVTSGESVNTLHWNAVPNAASYEIYFCSTNCETTSPPDPANWSVISRASADILKRDFTHTEVPPGMPLSNGTAYHYVVRAVVAGVASPFSSRVSAVPKVNSKQTTTPAPYPNGIRVTAGNNHNTIRWEEVGGTGVVRYSLYKGTSPGVTAAVAPIADSISMNTFTDTSAANGQPAYYMVIATKDGTPSDSSAEVSAVPQQPTALFVGTGGGGLFASGPAGEFRSTANGTTNPLGTTDALDVSSLLIDPATLTQDLPTLYAGTRDGVYRTVDGGANWFPYKATADGGTLPAVLSLVQRDSNLYAGTASGIYQGFTDAVAPWTFLGHPTLAITSLSIDPANPQVLYATSATAGIFKSIDGGTTWSPSNQGLNVLDVRSLSIHPLNSNLLYAGAVGTVFKSTNGGGEWTPIDLGTLDNVSNPLPTATIQTLAATPGAGSILYAGGSAGIFKSVDQGKGWAAMNTQLGTKTVIALEVHPVKPAVLYAAVAEQGIYKSLDGGGSWRLENGLPEAGAIPSTLIPSNVTDLVIDPNQADRFYAATAGLGVFQGSEDADGHLLWQPVNTGLGSSTILTLAAAPGVPTTVYAGSFQSGIFKLTDDGTGWQDVGGILSDKRILTLAVHPARPATLFAGLSTGLYRSVDAGLTWGPVTGFQGFDVLTVSFDSAANPATPLIYVGTSSGVYKSGDDGASWTYMDDGMFASVPAILVDPQQQTTVYAGTLSTGLFKRTQ